ncbi:cysteine protease StiP family protein [Dactylosporangium sp. NPDC005555]|uniref:cysteine protease StiP family protein n=1 Tax=Dactylosporangium sp. NPDC005555 TaxID=3154889 RepID=UPI0033BB10FB
MNVQPPAPLHGPEFSSYAASEVSWLLTDLSHVALEAPAAEREAMMQAKAGHYAESLPIEYQPTGEYLDLFHEALAASAERVAHAVGVVTELVLAARSSSAVLVSLARAGTPVGILMRRWARFAHGVQLPHYAVSIVRSRGIDLEAMRYLARHHDPAQVMFVDGWTGKGAICRELREAVTLLAESGGPAFDPQLAVLADPGGCTGVFGTRDDFLIPSACLNSTVSGLVSRTVLNDRYIGPGRFHGAKFYQELAPGDVSGLFLDAIEACFPAVAARVAADWPALAATDRTPDWSGWKIALRLSEEYGLDDVNLLKPGVGETTRVLLRRSPWRVLIRPDARAELGHVLLLAKDTGIPVDEVADLPYACVGLIRPKGAKGATQ